MVSLADLPFSGTGRRECLKTLLQGLLGPPASLARNTIGLFEQGDMTVP